MKREIKFNAWSGTRMLKNVGVHPHMIKSLVHIPNCENQDSDCDYEKDAEGSIIVCQKFDAYILLQLTGLTDKNGKDIYEGDILRTFHFIDDLSHVKAYLHHKVVYDNEKGVFNAINLKSEDELLTTHGNCFLYVALKDESIEVIGNIYENPELIK